MWVSIVGLLGLAALFAGVALSRARRGQGEDSNTWVRPNDLGARGHNRHREGRSGHWGGDGFGGGGFGGFGGGGGFGGRRDSTQ